MGMGMVRLIAALAIWSLSSTLVLAELQFAERTADLVLQIYDQADTEGRRVVEANFNGTAKGLVLANAYLIAVRKQRPLFCPPEKLVITGTMAIDVLRQAVRENPNIGKSNFTVASFQSLQNVFPCPK